MTPVAFTSCGVHRCGKAHGPAASARSHLGLIKAVLGQAVLLTADHLATGSHPLQPVLLAPPAVGVELDDGHGGLTQTAPLLPWLSPWPLAPQMPMMLRPPLPSAFLLLLLLLLALKKLLSAVGWPPASASSCKISLDIAADMEDALGT